MDASSRKSHQEANMRYEMQKDTGEYPIVGVNTLQEAPATLERLQQVVAENGIVFAAMIRRGM